jgi:hypothetical protein
MFVEHNATITGIEFKRGINMRASDSLGIEYRYFYENKIYEKSGIHFLPKGYPEDKVSEYILNWKQMHPIGTNVQITVNAWHPGYSRFSQLSGFKTASTSWFVNFYIYFFVYYWMFPMLFFTLTSMAIKYFFMRTRNDK